MSDWKQTPTLDEFAAMYDEDEHLWWRIGCGHHQNLYEAAVERYERAEATIQRVREVVEYDRYTVTLPTANWNTQLESMDNPYRAEVVLSADILEALEVPNE